MSENALGLKRIHHVEYWLGNAKQASYYYRKAFGFSQIAYAGLETGSKDQTSYVLEQEKVRLVLTTSMVDESFPRPARRRGEGHCL